MAERRMFAKTIIDSDAFLDMPISSQCLYFHLSMRADDEGFINKPKTIMRMIGAKDDDMNVLITRKFIIPFESGVVVIKHWKIHNYIRADRLHYTKYVDEKAELSMDENNSYTLCQTSGRQLVDSCPTEVRLGKVRLGKVNNTISKDIVSSTKVQPIVDRWNSLGLQKIVAINEGTNRYKLLNARIKEYGEETILQALDNISESSFLKGQNNKGWTITFDWFIKPNNFLKVLEGNYKDKEDSYGHNTSSTGENKKWDYSIPECNLTEEERRRAEEELL